MTKVFVSGIGTEVGKTVVSAVLARALSAAYWKPVQAGELEYTDSHKIRDWTADLQLPILAERYALKMPASPHRAAAAEQIQIKVSDFQLPSTNRNLIVEGAGGLLVPYNDQENTMDLIHSLSLPVVLVSRHYLGSITQTLLSLQVLRQAKIPLAALIFVGEPKPTTASIITAQSGVEALFRMPLLADITQQSIAREADRFGPLIRKHFKHAEQ